MLMIFAVSLLVFGPKRLPELAKGMGKGIRDFKKALSGDDEIPPVSNGAKPLQAKTIAAAPEIRTAEGAIAQGVPAHVEPQTT
jgi:sec-independent protein translocase protein TatA